MKELTKIEEMLLLAIWQLGDDAYGVKIRQHVSEVIRKDFTYGNLYSALNQLVVKKYVTKTVGEHTPERRGRSKIYYRLTRSGIQALKEARRLQKLIWDGLPELSPDEG